MTNNRIGESQLINCLNVRNSAGEYTRNGLIHPLNKRGLKEQIHLMTNSRNCHSQLMNCLNVGNSHL
jgi:hypothetical protein